MSVDYVFPGLYPFIEQAAADLSFEDLTYIGKAKQLWHSSQIQSSLGSVGHSRDLEGRLGILRHACHVRASLAVALRGVDLAIGKVVTEFDLPQPDWMTVPDAPTHISEPDPGGVRDDLGATQGGQLSSNPAQPDRREPAKSKPHYNRNR